MKPNSWRTFLLPAVVILAVGGVYFLYSKKRTPGKCETHTESFKVKDRQMSGVLALDQEVKVIMNWYKCNPAEKGDIVLYRYSPEFDPVVKIVRAVEGDKFTVTKDKKWGAWNITINGDMLMDDSKEPHYFGAAAPTVLSLFEKGQKGKLGPGEVLVFSNVSPGQNDSGLYGVANISELIGKVESGDAPPATAPQVPPTETPTESNAKDKADKLEAQALEKKEKPTEALKPAAKSKVKPKAKANSKPKVKNKSKKH